MEKETALTSRQEKLLKIAIVRTLTDKAQKYLNDKEVTKRFPMIADMTEKIVIEFNEANLVDKANKEIREDLEKEKFPQERTD
jgi:5-bromo-4-chloroindolyl phosphate hydrolysis protein